MRAVALVAGCLVLAGCFDPNYLSGDETVLDTDGSLNQKFHIAAHYPTGATLNFNGYLIGFEKGSRGNVYAPPVADYLKPIRPEDGQDDPQRNRLAHDAEIQARLTKEPKFIFPSHAIKYAVTGDLFPQVRPCFVMTQYPTVIRDHQAPMCEDTKTPGKALAHERPQQVSPAQFGLEALRHTLADQLIADVEAARGGYSHILVMSQGWNTSQEESIRNFNSMVSSLMAAVPDDGARFKPLIVTMSWPSMWNLDVELISYPNKSADADEIGLLGANLVVNDAVAQVKKRFPKLKVVVIGHSFGARLMSRATFSGDYLKERPLAAPVVDLFVGLQGAFSINRFREGSSWEGAPYADLSKVGAVVLTSSSNDTVNPVAFWSDHAGSFASWEKVCTSPKDERFACESVNPEGEWTTRGASSYQTGKVTFVDASSLISTNASGTGGKAHSDIYRSQHGCFLWQAISRLEGSARACRRN